MIKSTRSIVTGITSVRFSMLLALLLSFSIAHAESPTKCDVLAADPDDASKIVDGVDFEGIEVKKAKKACKKEILKYPDNPRMAYQYGRALHKYGDYTKAVKYYREAAKKDYAAAMYSFGFMLENGLGVAKNDAKAVRWYSKAADRGYVRSTSSANAK